MIQEEPETTDPTALAVAGLTATVRGLNDTMERGFRGVTDRQDTQNGRLREVEVKTTKIVATMVTTTVCERIRRGISNTTGENWKRFLIPVGVALAVLGMSKLFGG